MNRGRLRRYALRVVAAVALGVGLLVTATGIAHADTLSGSDTNSVGKVVNTPGSGFASPSEIIWN
jgi:hypothetical protein